jgi:hypothetical protein
MVFGLAFDDGIDGLSLPLANSIGSRNGYVPSDRLTRTSIARPPWVNTDQGPLIRFFCNRLCNNAHNLFRFSAWRWIQSWPNCSLLAISLVSGK